MVEHDRAWRACAAAQATVKQQVRADLATSTDLTLGEIEVLDQLQNDDGMRMAELADRVFTSRSGLTRRIDRLVRKGLIVRMAAIEDGRGVHAALTERGQEVAREIVPHYWASVARRFGDRLEPHSECVVSALERFA